jgi:subtilisin family serine protease
MRIHDLTRAAIVALPLFSLIAGCSRTEVAAPDDSTPLRMDPLEDVPILDDPFILPSSDWVVITDPAGLEDVIELDVDVIGYDDYGTDVVALVTAGPGVTQEDLVSASQGAVLPNDPVSSTVGTGSLVIGFVDGEFDEGGTTAWLNLNLPGVHSLATGEGVRIGIVDTGAAMSHPALVDHVVAIQGSRLPQTEEEPNGINDDPENDDLIDEGWGHGTFVAGEVAITAPGVEILPVRALNSEGLGSVIDVISGMYFCRLHGCDIINLSLSFSDYHAEFEKLLVVFRSEGILVAAAAGNAGPALTYFPASSPYCVSVTALTERFRFPAFASQGPLVDLAAPGWRITSVAITSPTQRAYASGTSMAVPIVCGSIAILMEEFNVSALASYGHLRLHTQGTIPQSGTLYGAVDPFLALHETPVGGI